jgi:hypothetical protein
MAIADCQLPIANCRLPDGVVKPETNRQLAIGNLPPDD